MYIKYNTCTYTCLGLRVSGVSGLTFIVAPAETITCSVSQVQCHVMLANRLAFYILQPHSHVTVAATGTIPWWFERAEVS